MRFMQMDHIGNTLGLKRPDTRQEFVKTTPSEKISERPSTFTPANCSGDM